ncbi:hypothetical protein LPJ59_001195 [Coemansia sp. RSA 2399]|nr:hypothetical protein LPJ59_001195 [Coemansia sp. RSA 2399]KAJ1896204.1 hypothetical protein LPJ81_004793 [Coemansia sp. IMI 209127]
MVLNTGFVAKGKRRRADTGEYEGTADRRPQLLTKRQRSASHYPDELQKLSAPGALLADSDDYQRQRMMTCAAMEPMLLDHYDAQHGDGGAMLATPATSPPHGVSDSDEGQNGGDDWEDDDDDDDELDPASEYYEISKLLNQLHRERVMRRKQS